MFRDDKSIRHTKKNYKLIEGVGENGGYHAQVFMSSLFSQMDFS